MNPIRLASLFGLLFMATLACERNGIPTGGQGGAVAGHFDAAAGGEANLGSDAAPSCRPGPPCASGWFAYTDSVCPYPPTNPCKPAGDGLCYQSCNTDSDCTDQRFPVCGKLDFFNGSDYSQAKPACMSRGAISACPQPIDGGQSRG